MRQPRHQIASAITSFTVDKETGSSFVYAVLRVRIRDEYKTNNARDVDFVSNVITGIRIFRGFRITYNKTERNSIAKVFKIT